LIMFIQLPYEILVCNYAVKQTADFYGEKNC
jgi:hypothetical protein